MSNPLYYVVGLVLALSYPLGMEPLWFARGEIGLGATLGALPAFGVLAWVVHRAARPERLGLARLALRWLAVFLYAALLFVFHFPLWVWKVGLEDSLFLGPLLTLAPLLGFFALLSLIGAWFDPRRRGSFRTAVVFAFRSFAGFSLLPILLILALEVAQERVSVLREAAFLYPAAQLLFSVAVMLLFVALLPILLRLAFGARPLEEGPLRDRMERICRESQFRCAELLVLGTGGSRMANAFIVGIAGPVRCVFFTDALLSGMSAPEVECVLAHEIAHSRRGHMRSFLAGMLGFMLLSAAALELLEAAKVPTAVSASLLLAWGGFFWIGIFGWVSRRFESEADLAAARLVSTASTPYGAAPTMAAALDRVAELNRIAPWAWSWRHFSITRRIDLLLRAMNEPATGLAFEGLCRKWRRTSGVLLLAGVASVGIQMASDAGKVERRRQEFGAYRRLELGREKMKEGRLDEAVALFRAGVGEGADEGLVWLWISDCEHGLGHEGEARFAWEKAREKGVTDPRARLRLRK